MRRIVPRLRSPMKPAPSPSRGTSAHVMIWPALLVAADEGPSTAEAAAGPAPVAGAAGAGAAGAGAAARPDCTASSQSPTRCATPVADARQGESLNVSVNGSPLPGA